jgi:hypothetical protein
MISPLITIPAGAKPPNHKEAEAAERKATAEKTPERIPRRAA